MAKKKAKGDILLVCQKCSQHNYRTTKSVKNKSGKILKLNLRKYCKFCQKTQAHQERAVK